MLRFGQLIARNSRNLKKIELNSENLRFFSATPAAVPKIQHDEKPVSSQPTQSASEQKNLSFMANLFRGELEATELFPFPEALNDDRKETISMLIDPTTKFFTQINNAAKNDERAHLDKETESALWDLGAYALQIPEEFGGLELNNTQLTRLQEMVGLYDLGIGVILGAHQSIGFKGILLYGTDEQKRKYLPRIANERQHAAFCLTEPSSGSDASSIKTRAVKSPCGKFYTLNGSKIWISNGGVAEIFTVFAKTEITDPKTGQKKDKVTAFIVERAFGGLTNGPPEQKMGIKCSNTSALYFEDCKVPIENVLGGEGDGFKVAMNILNNGRFGMAGTMSGTMRACIEKATEHAKNRVQFGHKLETYESVQEKLAKMSMLHYVSQSMAYMLSGNMDTGSNDYHLEAAISKIFSSEAAWNVCDEAIQILGGMGFMKEAGLERVLRDLRIFRIFEGANDILRLFVALTGIQYAGSHLKELQKAFQNPAANLGLIFKESSKRAIRTFGYGGVDITGYVAEPLTESARYCSQNINQFGQTVESLLIKHGKGIIEQQFLLNRLADAAIDTYAMAVVLSRATRAIQKNLPSAEHETLMAQAWCVDASDRVSKNLQKIHDNKFTSNYKRYKQIAKNICKNDGVAHQNPLEIQ
uniref:Very long-chain specific acyl-CoA dehydrogenase, mitochondrial n=1 Tax=Corethrella appendiculata TaxID=1370023 RepID=U5EW83_9DIPT